MPEEGHALHSIAYSRAQDKMGHPIFVGKGYAFPIQGISDNESFLATCVATLMTWDTTMIFYHHGSRIFRLEMNRFVVHLPKMTTQWSLFWEMHRMPQDVQIRAARTWSTSRCFLQH